MIRTLLTTTALVAVLSTGALAQSETVNKSKDMTVGVTVFTDSDLKPMQSQNGYFSAMQGQVLASTLIGKTIYNGTSNEAEALGDVNDVVLSPNGSAEAIVIGVGGFLGIGEKYVAVDFERVNWADVNDEKRLTMVATKDELDTAPEFDTAVITASSMETSETIAAAPVTSDDQAQAKSETRADTDLQAGMTPVDRSTESVEAPVTSDDQAQAKSETRADTDLQAGMPPVDRSTESVEAPVKSDDQAQAKSETRADTDLRAGMTPVDRSTVSVENLLGVTVYGANNESIGEIGDVIIGTDNMVEAYIVDVGGFLGMGEKPVALDGSSLDIVKDGEGNLRVHTPYTQERLTASTAYSADGYRTDRNSIVLR